MTKLFDCFFLNQFDFSLSGRFFVTAYLYFPVTDSSLCTVETDADFHQSLAGGLVRKHITFGVYLLQSLLGGLSTYRYLPLRMSSKVCIPTGYVFTISAIIYRSLRSSAASY